MSRDRRHLPPQPVKAPAAPPALKSDSVIVGPFKLAALTRTTNGFAVVVVELGANGELISMDVGRSQSFPDPVSREVVKKQAAISQETLRRYPWRPG